MFPKKAAAAKTPNSSSPMTPAAKAIPGKMGGMATAKGKKAKGGKMVGKMGGKGMKKGKAC